MNINHLGLSVKSVADNKQFFTGFLGFTCIEEKGNGAIAILVDNAGFLLVLAQNKKQEETLYPDNFHIGFLQNSDAQVYELYNKLVEGGVRLDGGPQKIRGKLGFYFYAPDNLLIEVGQ